MTRTRRSSYIIHPYFPFNPFNPFMPFNTSSRHHQHNAFRQFQQKLGHQYHGVTKLFFRIALLPGLITAMIPSDPPWLCGVGGIRNVNLSIRGHGVLEDLFLLKIPSYHCHCCHCCQGLHVTCHNLHFDQ